MIEVEIVCNRSLRGKHRLGYRVSDTGIGGEIHETLEDRIEELREEVDLRTLSDGEVVETVEIGCEDAD